MTAPSRIAICTPCQDTVVAGTCLDMVRMVAKTMLALPGLDITVMQVRGTILPQQRHDLVVNAQEAGCSHLLWVDSDMRFPAETLLQLLSHEQPIVACNYATRRLPITPTAQHADGFVYTADTVFAETLTEVDHCGMGLMLVDMTVYETIPAPWFAIGYSPKTSDYAGEDVFFCRKATQAGFPVQIDHGLSRFVKHVGAFEYENRHACLTRDTVPA